MNEQINKVRAVLVSVGGSSEPILFTLKKFKPEFVWYFCSLSSENKKIEGSIEKVKEIHKQLEWNPVEDYIEVEKCEELGDCYKLLRKKIPELLKKWNVKPEEVVVDYTGGTKTMSAALVLAGVELFKQFIYIGGEQRDKGGLGVVIGGKERFLYQQNPWDELAVREIERAKFLWDNCIFESAGEVINKVADKVQYTKRFKTIAEVALGLAERHRLNFKNAVHNLGKAKEHIQDLYDGKDDSGLIDFVEQCVRICGECSKGRPNEILLRELIDNAIRTAKQGRYEDASARLYRAMEMQGQLWLEKVSGGVFVNGMAKRIENVPDKIKEQFLKSNSSRTTNEPTEIKLALEDLFRAIVMYEEIKTAEQNEQFGEIFERARKVVDDISSGIKNSKWRDATQSRNSSILGHGVTPIGKDGFEKICKVAEEFLGLNTREESNPILPLNELWFFAPDKEREKLNL